MTYKYIPPCMPGYVFTLSADGRLILALHKAQPTLYLDQASMKWRVLDRHVSEVHPAHSPSKC